MRKFTIPLMLVCGALLLLACNLARQVPASSVLQPTATPGGVRFTPRSLPPSITPLFGAPVATAIPGQTPVIGQPTPIVGGTTPVRTPGTVTVTIPTGQIGDFVSYVFNNIAVPILNLAVGMIASSATYLWQQAGALGGWIGQVGCCIVPALGALFYVFGGRRRFRRRR